jgi:hypothetical protein
MTSRPSATSSASPLTTPSSTPTASFRRGDANCDAKVTAADITALLQVIGSPPRCGADANGDGKVDAQDLLVTIDDLFH